MQSYVRLCTVWLRVHFCPTGGAVNPQTNLQHFTEELPCCSTRWSRSEGLDTPTTLSVCEFVMESQWKEPEISGFSAWNRGSNHPRQSRTVGIRLSVPCSTPLPPLDSVYTPSSRPELEYLESPHWPEPHYRQNKKVMRNSGDERGHNLYEKCFKHQQLSAELLTVQTAAENVSGCGNRASLLSPTQQRSTVSLEGQSKRILYPHLLTEWAGVKTAFLRDCFYLFEVGVLRNLHQLHLLLLSLDHEGFLDVFSGAEVQRHRDDLSGWKRWDSGGLTLNEHKEKLSGRLLTHVGSLVFSSEGCSAWTPPAGCLQCHTNDKLIQNRD